MGLDMAPGASFWDQPTMAPLTPCGGRAPAIPNLPLPGSSWWVSQGPLDRVGTPSTQLAHPTHHEAMWAPWLLGGKAAVGSGSGGWWAQDGIPACPVRPDVAEPTWHVHVCLLSGTTLPGSKGWVPGPSQLARSSPEASAGIAKACHVIHGTATSSMVLPRHPQPCHVITGHATSSPCPRSHQLPLAGLA